MPATACVVSRSSTRVALDRFVGELLLGEDEALVATFNHLPRTGDAVDDAAVEDAKCSRIAEAVRRHRDL